MKKTGFLFILIVCSVCVFAQTQSKMNSDAGDSLRKADYELNQVYKKILTDYKSDTVFVKNLKISQRLWIQFRDAEMNMKYPERQAGYYGSVYPMCWSMYKEQLTRDRIKTLRQWLSGTDEGDVCNGSTAGPPTAQ
jgi:uncharacterized protein YecT (DUF1311 family)